MKLSTSEEKFLLRNSADAAIEHNADFVGSSALLTTTMTVQKDVEDAALKEAGIRDKVKTMVGGAPVTNRWAEKIGADAVCEDASGYSKLYS